MEIISLLVMPVGGLVIAFAALYVVRRADRHEDKKKPPRKPASAH